MKYRKKPIVIEAVQFTGTINNLEELSNFIDNQELVISYKNPKCAIIKLQTLEGQMTVSLGDYIIKGIQGEFYPCKPDIFVQTYEQVGE